MILRIGSFFIKDYVAGCVVDDSFNTLVSSGLTAWYQRGLIHSFSLLFSHVSSNDYFSQYDDLLLAYSLSYISFFTLFSTLIEVESMSPGTILLIRLIKALFFFA